MQHYHLMLADELRAVYSITPIGSDFWFDEVERFGELPLGFRKSGVGSWIDSRRNPGERAGLGRLLCTQGIRSRVDLIERTACLSAMDCWWMKSADSPITWDQVSVYRNALDEQVAAVAFDNGFYPEEHSIKEGFLLTPEFSMDGTFPKCVVRREGGLSLLKRGWNASYNPTPSPHPYSEVLACQLYEAFGTAHARYELVEHRGQLATICELPTSESVSFVPLRYLMRDLYEGDRCTIYDLLNFMEGLGAGEEWREALILDALTLNEDRHLGNAGFRTEARTGEILGFAPLYDSNMACATTLMDGPKRVSVEEYISKQRPTIGASYVGVARAMLNDELRERLAGLRDFAYISPGYGYPDWMIDALNRIKDIQLKAILK